MNLVSLYKTFDGGEFVDASLASIYDHCSDIIMVHSDVSWLGERGNTVRPLALEWCSKNDKEGKVHHLNCELGTQEEQYAFGLDFINHYQIPFDAIMAIDADEIWEDQHIENAKRQIHDQPFAAYRSNMHTYLKTPFFRVAPPYGSPTVFLREPKYLTESARGHRAPAKQLSDVWMHHYTYVRETRADVERKLRQSCLADGNETVVPRWMEDVYDRLPEGKNLHGFKRWSRVWTEIEKAWISDMPPAVRSAKAMPLWWPDDRQIFGGQVTDWVSMLDGEKNAIYRLAKGRYQAVDLGTYRGVSAVTLALACRKVHTIDFYEQAKKDQASEYFSIGGHSLASTQAFCDRFGNITCESADTVEAANRWKGPIDVLMVDAEHTEDGTLANVNAWIRHMKIGGIIIFHDDIDSLPGVKAAINRLRGDKRFRFFDPGEYSGSIAVCEVLSK